MSGKSRVNANTPTDFGYSARNSNRSGNSQGPSPRPPSNQYCGFSGSPSNQHHGHSGSHSHGHHHHGHSGSHSHGTSHQHHSCSGNGGYSGHPNPQNRPNGGGCKCFYATFSFSFLNHLTIFSLYLFQGIKDSPCILH